MTVLFSATLVVLRIDGAPVVCKTDEVGEICMNSGAIGSAYWGLPGLTNTTFKVRPLPEDGSISPWETEFVRTGLLGFLGPVSSSSSHSLVMPSWAKLLHPQ